MASQKMMTSVATFALMSLIIMSFDAPLADACGGQYCSGMCAIGQECNGVDGDCYCAPTGLTRDNFTKFAPDSDAHWLAYQNRTNDTQLLKSLCSEFKTPIGSFGFMVMDGQEGVTVKIVCYNGFPKIQVVNETHSELISKAIASTA